MVALLHRSSDFLSRYGIVIAIVTYLILTGIFWYKYSLFFVSGVAGFLMVACAAFWLTLIMVLRKVSDRIRLTGERKCRERI